MLTIVHIPHLIADDTSVPYGCINVDMRMTSCPYIYSAFGNKITQFGWKGAVQYA